MGKIKKIRSDRGLPKVSLEEQLTSDKLPKKRNREPKIKFRFEEEEKVRKFSLLSTCNNIFMRLTGMHSHSFIGCRLKFI